MSQNHPKFHFYAFSSSDLRKHHQDLDSVPKFRLGAKSFLATPPAKADIATAILTNVIEHLVLLFAP